VCMSHDVSFYIFFFSSRRRHTRWPRDWSSDVCSSDLAFEEMLDFNTVYLEKHELYKEIKNDESLKSKALLEILSKEKTKSLIYEIGRASCRERVYISEGNVTLKKKIEESDERENRRK